MVTTLQNRLLLALALFVASPAWAILQQTSEDLAVLEDALRYRMEKLEMRQATVPMLVATPVHHWKESRTDFASTAMTALKSVFDQPSELINCPECDTWRLDIDKGRTVNINNGELGYGEIAAIKERGVYGDAKSIATVKETPSGVMMKIVSLDDGRVLFSMLADSSQDLEGVKPYTHYSQELDRRLAREGLSYTFINLGLYPNPLFQVEFVEQWGPRNQHISGVVLSLINPVGAIGATYHYLLPHLKRMNVSLSLLYPLQGLVQESDNLSDEFVVQGMVQWNFARSYGLFAALGTGGELSIGINLFNPLLMPFVF